MGSNQLRFDGKVAVVTGAGGGLGREYALLLAERGASVVVNDLGGSFKGEGQSQSAADKVVQEIQAKGGKAVANYDSVDEGHKIIQTAIESFRRVDIVINNAGILRDRSLLKTADKDWDLIHQVHLRGAFKVTRAAWPYMKEQKFGRIIMTASGAGIFGNFGQANYSSAKLGLVGLSNTVGIEGGKYGIHSNVIVPIAGSRMTQDIIPPDLFEKLKPECVAPVVAWLCHEECSENGGIFQSAGGWIGKYRWQRSLGVSPTPHGKLTPEAVRDSWEKVVDMNEGSFPGSIQEDLVLVTQALEEAAESSVPSNEQADEGDDAGGPINVKKALSTKFSPIKFTYSAKDCILYALGVGVSTKDKNHLKFLYEGSEDFCVLPTFAVVAAQHVLMESGFFTGGAPGIQVDLSKLLHGEQYVELYQPLAANNTLQSRLKVEDILDKTSGAVALLSVETRDPSGELVARNQFSIFLVGSGGFGGKRNSDKVIPTVAIPNRSPDAEVQTKTGVDQPALYRLSGDRNPLHIDPSFAAMGGFAQPIMHGLCSLGIAVRQVLLQYAGDDVEKFKSLKARFAKPVIPGQTLKTQMWQEGNRIIFQSIVVETGNVAIQGGYVDLTGIAAATQAAPQAVSKSGNLQSEAVFEELARRLKSMPDIVKTAKGCYQWDITKDGKPSQTWTVDLKTGPGSIYTGVIKSGKPDVTLTLDDADMVLLATGKMNPQKAFMSGKLKIKGNIMLTQKLQALLKNQAKL